MTRSAKRRDPVTHESPAGVYADFALPVAYEQAVTSISFRYSQLDCAATPPTHPVRYQAARRGRPALGRNSSVEWTWFELWY